MPSPSPIGDYLALWQSLAGALGAFAVAAFTVWRSNKHATEREERQERQRRTQERQQVLREKLEALVTDCETCYRETSQSVQGLLRAAEAIRSKQPGSHATLKLPDIVASMSSAVVAARIYFPPIADLVYEFNRELGKYSSATADRVTSALGDAAIPIESPVSIAKLKELRFAILDAARKLIESDFEGLIK